MIGQELVFLNSDWLIALKNEMLGQLHLFWYDGGRVAAAQVLKQQTVLIGR
jgi:hypothetical protein